MVKKTEGLKLLRLIFILISFQTFGQENDSIPPCLNSGHPKIHFVKYSQNILETECDSLNHLVEMINSDSTTNYFLIGIATDKNPEEKFKAKSRAELVKVRLVNLGVKAERLSVTLAYHKPPAKGKPRDWPFYPNWYEYEIGVYLEINN